MRLRNLPRSQSIHSISLPVREVEGGGGAGSAVEFASQSRSSNEREVFRAPNTPTPALPPTLVLTYPPTTHITIRAYNIQVRIRGPV